MVLYSLRKVCARERERHCVTQHSCVDTIICGGTEVKLVLLYDLFFAPEFRQHSPVIALVIIAHLLKGYSNLLQPGVHFLSFAIILSSNINTVQTKFIYEIYGCTQIVRRKSNSKESEQSDYHKGFNSPRPTF